FGLHVKEECRKAGIVAGKGDGDRKPLEEQNSVEDFSESKDSTRHILTATYRLLDESFERPQVRDNKTPRYGPGLGVNRAKAVDGFDFEDVTLNQMQQNSGQETGSEGSSERMEYISRAKGGESGNFREEGM
ncbi:hypothetical protein PIB30_016109, partial [Stylosanthes scabra]|nr:hypothetical protein [Stylosanthes scabra]